MKSATIPPAIGRPPPLLMMLVVSALFACAPAAPAGEDGDVVEATQPDTVEEVAEDTTPDAVDWDVMDVTDVADTADSLTPDASTDDADAELDVSRIDLSNVPLNPDCVDGVWSPVPGWGAEAGFERDLGTLWTTQITVPAEGGVFCRDGIRVWVPPVPTGEALEFSLGVSRSVPFGSALTMHYSVTWPWGGDTIWPAGHTLVVELGEVPGRLPIYNNREIRSTRQAVVDNLGREPTPIDWVERTPFGWRLQMEWFGILHIGRDRPEPLCGNGVLDPTEWCDPGLDDTRLCNPNLCWPRVNSDCDANGCYDGENLAAQCERPSTQCWQKLPWIAVYGCGGRPINEGTPCNLDEPFLASAHPQLRYDDENVGVCFRGDCVVPENVECEGCDPEVVKWNETTKQARYVDGQCRIAARRSYTPRDQVLESGRCDPVHDSCDNCPDCDYNEDGTWVGAPSGTPYFRIDYRHLDWEAGPEGMQPTERYELEVLWDDNFVEQEPFRVTIPAEPYGEVGSFIYEPPETSYGLQLEFAGFSSLRPAGELSQGLEVYDAVTFTYETERCEIAFEVGDDVSTCPIFPTVIDCDDTCIDPLSDNNNCGGCGNVCRGGDQCVEGECVCHPALVAVNPDGCNGCPEGFGGNQCERQCLGQIGEGIYCNGNGRCNGGPTGSGTCICDPGYHGAGCVYSCSDGIRNGEEWNVDCGGYAAACGLFCGTGDDALRD